MTEMKTNSASELLNEDEIFDMTNVPKRYLRIPSLPDDVKINILQLGDWKTKLGPRAKVFRKSPKGGPNFSIRLSKDKSKVVLEPGDASFLDSKQTADVINHVKKYRTAYLALSNDTGMDVEELRALMDKIDSEEKTHG